MKTLKKSSLHFKTLIYLIIFSVSILVVLMFSQNMILKYSYERYQIKKIKNIGNIIEVTKDYELISKLESIAYENGVCIEYVFNTSEVSNYNTLMVGCELNKNNKQITKLMTDIINSNKNKQNIKLVNKDSDTKALLSGVKVNNGYVFIYSTLEDLDGASIIFKGQLIYITLIVIVLAIVISYFLSIKITKPITNITKKAKEVGEGKYDVKFDVSDVLEINELSNALNHMESDLSKIDILRRDLMANVSHDLKTPLTMIRAYAEMVRDISYQDHDKMTKDLNVIIEETERLNVLVNDILDLSKMQADADTLNIEEFDFVSLIHEVMQKLEILKTTEDYHFILDLREKCVIKADRKKMFQAVYNLVTNAINYTGDDKKVFITLSEAKKEYIFEVRDTGKGIKKEEIPYIWDKYYKKDKKHQRNVVSTGLGLSIVKEILVNHKFDYGVKSTPNKGSTFYFKIKK